MDMDGWAGKGSWSLIGFSIIYYLLICLASTKVLIFCIRLPVSYLLPQAHQVTLVQMYET